MKRLAWDLLAAASLLAFVASAVMWVSSYWWYDEVGVTVGRQLLAFNSAHGDSCWVWDTDFGGDSNPYVRREPLKDSIYGGGIAPSLDYHFAGFAVRYRQDKPASGGPATMFRVLAIPCWFLLAATAAIPVIWMTVTRRARRRITRGLCAGCGYDLRASTDRCPECGRSF